MENSALPQVPSAKSNSVFVTVCDSGDLIGAKQLFTAAVDKGSWIGDRVLLGFRLDSTSKNWFEERGIHVVDAEAPFNPSLHKTRKNNPSSEICLIKAHLFSDAFKSWETVVYMDTDILIRGSIAKLEDVGAFSAVTDSLMELKDHFEKGTDFSSRLPNYKKYLRAFNAGVFAFKTASLPENAFESFKKIADEFSEQAAHSDQSFMNLLFAGNWKKLPDEYNAEVNMYTRFRTPLINRITDRARVLHFAGINKPSDPEHRFAREWEESIAAAIGRDDFAASKLTAGRETVSPTWKVEIAFRYLRLKKWLRSKARRCKWGLIGLLRPRKND